MVFSPSLTHFNSCSYWQCAPFPILSPTLCLFPILSPTLPGFLYYHPHYPVSYIITHTLPVSYIITHTALFPILSPTLCLFSILSPTLPCFLYYHPHWASCPVEVRIPGPAGPSISSGVPCRSLVVPLSSELSQHPRQTPTHL